MAQLEIYRAKYGTKYIVTFDDIDIQLVYVHDWRISKRDNTNYAFTTINGKTVMMHQLIMPNNNKLLVHDHIDHNGLNNCRGNLRLITQAENCQRKRSTNSNTGHKGVSYIESRRLYQSTIQVKGRSINLGRFKDIENAIAAYKFASKLYFGVD